MPVHSQSYLADGLRPGPESEKQIIRVNERWESTCKWSVVHCDM